MRAYLLPVLALAIPTIVGCGDDKASNVTPPVGLEILSTTPIDGIVRRLCVVDDELYGAAGDHGLLIWDVSNPQSPAPLSLTPLPGSAYHVSVVGSRAYVATHDGSGLYIIDVQDPVQPVVTAAVGLPDSTIERIDVHDGLGLAAHYWGGVSVLDMTDPDAPTILGTILLPDQTYDARFVHGCGETRMAVATGGELLYSLDLENPSSPQVLASMLLDDIAYGLYIDGGHVYVANRYAGLIAIDVTCDGEFTLMSELPLPGNQRDVVVAGSRAYLASSEGSGLWAVDVSVPSNMILRHEVPLDGSKGVAVEGDRVYLGGDAISILAAD